MDFNFDIVTRDGKEYMENRGIDFGQKGLVIVWKLDEYIIAKEGGYVGWSGVGMKNYYPVRYILYKATPSNKPDYYKFFAKQIQEIESGKNWREIIATLKQVVFDAKNNV